MKKKYMFLFFHYLLHFYDLTFYHYSLDIILADVLSIIFIILMEDGSNKYKIYNIVRTV